MADTPSALTEQLQQNNAELAAQNLATAQQMQHSQEQFFATQSQHRAEIDAMINGGPTAMPPGFEGPHVEGMMPQEMGPQGPMMQAHDGQEMDGGPPMMMLDGQTPGLAVQQASNDGGGDLGDVVESLLGFDLDGDDEADGAGDIENIDDAVQLAQETGQVVVIQEVIVIDPNGSPQTDDDLSF